MGLAFKDISAIEDFLEKDFSRVKEDKRSLSRIYYALGKKHSKLGDFKIAKRYFWQSFFACPLRIGCLFKINRLNIKSGLYGYSAFKRNLELKRVLKNQRVLIIGSGPSANELKNIAQDIKILTCNIGPRILLDKKIRQEIDLYYCVPGAFEGSHKDENTIGLLSKFKIDLFIYPTKWIKNNSILKKIYAKGVQDNAFNDYYSKKLVGPQKTEEIKSSFLSNNRTSSGVRLLQYALFAQAKEIYLIGIDIDEKGYFWDRSNIHDHLAIDKNFIEVVSKKYNNIYSASKNSLITSYVKYKPLL